MQLPLKVVFFSGFQPDLSCHGLPSSPKLETGVEWSQAQLGDRRKKRGGGGGGGGKGKLLNKMPIKKTKQKD